MSKSNTTIRLVNSFTTAVILLLPLLNLVEYYEVLYNMLSSTITTLGLQNQQLYVLLALVLLTNGIVSIVITYNIFKISIQIAELSIEKKSAYFLFLIAKLIVTVIGLFIPVRLILEHRILIIIKEIVFTMLLLTVLTMYLKDTKTSDDYLKSLKKSGLFLIVFNVTLSIINYVFFVGI